jgi:hypothetical protein
MPHKYNKSFSGNENTNANNELASHNRFIFQFDGAAIAMVVGFCIILVTAALVYLIVSHAGLVIFMVVVGFSVLVVAAILAGVAIMASMTIRHISVTKAQFQIDRASEDWSRIAHPVGAHIVMKDPYTRQLSVHNASVVTENRHYNPEQYQIAQDAESLMPSLYDLTKDDQS